MKKIIAIFIFILTIVSAQTFAQTYLQPKLTIDVFGGYGTPVGDFKTDIPTATNADDETFPYYTKQLINFGADGKLALGKNGNFRVTFGITYNMFSNNTTALFEADSNGALVTTTFKPKVNILSIALGGEWAFAPTQKVNPYVGLGITGNFFGGSFEFGQSVFVKDAQRTAPMDMKSETRIGLLFDGGVNIRLSPQVGLNAGIKYHMINVTGKGADDESEIAANEIDLGDKAHISGEGVSIPARSVGSFSGYAGISFFLGMHK